jgi:hypothetical protein
MPNTPRPGQPNDQKSGQPGQPGQSPRPMETRPDDKSGGAGSDRKQGSDQR